MSKQLVGYDWAGFVFSVSTGTQGVPGSPIAAEGLGNRGCLWEYMAPESNVATPVNRTVRAMDSFEVSLDPAKSYEGDITGLDVYAPGLLHDSSVVNPLYADFTGVVFSVTRGSAGQAPASWFRKKGAPPTAPVSRSGAALLWCEWSAAAGWGGPYLLHPAARLGLTSADELDALAWHKHHGQEFLLFSSDIASQDAIMFVDLGSPTSTPTPLTIQEGGGKKTRASVKVGLKLAQSGLRIDDVDALSAFDPRIDSSAVIGVPIATGIIPELNATMFRHVDYPTAGSSYSALVTCMTALSPYGSEGYGLIWGRFPGGNATLLGWTAMPQTGEATDFEIPLPPLLIGTPLEVNWMATDDTGTLNLAESPWVRIDI